MPMNLPIPHRSPLVLAVLASLAVATILFPGSRSGPSPALAADKDCSDFATQAAA
jgi:hypothetical protein